MADKVVFETNLGSFTIELDADKAPKTVRNILDYVDAKHYDGTVFHRVIPGFMAQGGGYDESYEKKAVKDPVENEARQTDDLKAEVRQLVESAIAAGDLPGAVVGLPAE